MVRTLSNKSKIDKIAEEILNNSTNDIIEIGPACSYN